MSFHNPLAYSQAQADPRIPAAFTLVNLGELFEQIELLFLRYAPAAVSHMHCHITLIILQL
jgi:hypothetical protein